jgi:hypothetical protein
VAGKRADIAPILHTKWQKRGKMSNSLCLENALCQEYCIFLQQDSLVDKHTLSTYKEQSAHHLGFPEKTVFD